MDLVVCLTLPGFAQDHLAQLSVLGVLLLLATSPMRKPSRLKHRELAMLREISSMVNRSLDLTTVLGSALDQVMSLLGMDAGTFRVVAGADFPSPTAVYRGFSRDTVCVLEGEQEQGGPVQQQLVGNRPVILAAAAATNCPDVLSQALKKEGMQYFALYPVRAGNRMLGTLGLASRQPNALNEVQEDLVCTLTEILGVAIVNLQLRDEAHKLSEDLTALQEVNKIISQSFNLQEIIRRIVVEGKRLVKTSQCHLFLLGDGRLVGSASTETGKFDIRDVSIDMSDSSVAITAVVEKRVIAVEDLPRRPNDAHPDPMSWRSAIFAPLIAKDRAIGVLICSDNSRERSFTTEEIFRAETLAHQAAIALENARLFQVVSRSQKEWETTFDAMQDCVSVHDTSGKIVRANVALARRLKTTPPNIIGKYCSELFEPAGAVPGCRHIESLGSGALIVEEKELSIMGGTYQISVGPWYDKESRMAGSIHVAKDVSTEKLLQQQLIQSEKLSAIGELISGIAHELNNPLTGVMGYSQLLQLRKDLDGRAKDSLLKINNLALRCQKIVQNLLSFARKQKPERTLSDINEILEKTVELRNYELQVNNIEIVRELSPNLPRTIADAHQLQQVFLNLLTNAEQAMLEGHGKGRVVIRTRADVPNGRVIVEIVDDGPGIPESILTKIFDPFFTTKEVGKGTGLGLSLSYGIIKEHGGNIYARSRMGEGATFVVELPVIASLGEEAALEPALVPKAFQFENLVRGKRVLIVDDEKYILDFFVEVFSPYPMRVDTAANGRAAIEKIQGVDYDVIVTDFKMPHMSGRELFDWVTRERPHLARRIVFVTGDTVSVETRTFFESTSNRYLAKPFKIEEVKEVIQQTLESAKDKYDLRFTKDE